jgi:hypothetical protein
MDCVPYTCIGGQYHGTDAAATSSTKDQMQQQQQWYVCALKADTATALSTRLDLVTCQCWFQVVDDKLAYCQ